MNWTTNKSAPSRLKTSEINLKSYPRRRSWLLSSRSCCSTNWQASLLNQLLKATGTLLSNYQSDPWRNRPRRIQLRWKKAQNKHFWRWSLSWSKLRVVCFLESSRKKQFNQWSLQFSPTYAKPSVSTSLTSWWCYKPSIMACLWTIVRSLEIRWPTSQQS